MSRAVLLRSLFTVRNLHTRCISLFVKPPSALITSLPKSWTAVRYKSRIQKPNQRATVEEDDEDEEADDDELDIGHDEGKDYKDKTLIVSSLRLDSLAKTAFGLPRSEIPILIAKGLFRVDDQVVKSKATQINFGDVLDYLVGPFPDNPNLSIIQRCIIKKVNVAPSRTKVEIITRIWKQLIVDDFHKNN